MSRKISSVNDDLEQGNRRARVLSLHDRGYTQAEIAQQVGVTQQTVSMDLKHIKVGSRKVIEEFSKNASFEYVRYFDEMDQIAKKLWEITDNNNPDPHVNSNNRDKIAAPSLLMQCNKDRLEAFVGGPISEMSAMRHVSKMKNDEIEEKRYKIRLQNDDFFRGVEEGIIH